jgi:hypothetical protein
MNEDIYQLLLDQHRQIRSLKLQLEALKRMMFEHQPPFAASFEQQIRAVEASDFLRESDDAIRKLEPQGVQSRKS